MADRDPEERVDTAYDTAFFQVLGHPAGEVLRALLLSADREATGPEWRRVRDGLRRTDPWLARVIEDFAARLGGGTRGPMGTGPEGAARREHKTSHKHTTSRNTPEPVGRASDREGA